MIGVLLAGGESKRFGSPKAFAKLEGQFFYEKSFQALSTVCRKVLIVTREEYLSRFPSNLDVIVDCQEFRGQGPLAGIYTAMLQNEGNQFFVLPCDMPYINGDILTKMQPFSKDSLVTAVHYKEDFFPLVSIWNKAMQAHIRKRLVKKERSVIKLLGSIETKWIDGTVLTNDLHFYFQNVNRPH